MKPFARALQPTDVTTIELHAGRLIGGIIDGALGLMFIHDLFWQL